MKKPMRDNEQEQLDARVYELTYVPSVLSMRGETIYFSQRELRLIMKHTQNRNAHIYNKLRSFIDRIDDREKRKTDWSARVPKTHVIRLY